jgi:hypothetical protein
MSNGVIDREVTIFSTFIGQFFKQGNGEILILKALAVHQGHVGELTLLEIHSRIELLVERQAGQVETQRIGGPGQRRPPMNVAGKLIDQNNQREAAALGFGPSCELTLSCRLDLRAQASADFVIELIALLKPFFRPGFIEPKCQNVFG